MKIIYKIIFLFLLLNAIIACAKNEKSEVESDYIFKAPISAEPLPDDLVWLTNDSDPVFASPDAVTGGIFNSYIPSFPNTFRIVGPDSNNYFATYIIGNMMSLIGLHPNTENIIPEIATHWAFDKDDMTMYFKLNKRARWSDGKPVTAHDFAYTLEFMRSKHIIAPWYSDYYTKEIETITVYDNYTLAVKIPKPVPDIHIKIMDIWALPGHYYGKLKEDFVQKYNWEIAPNSGPYIITKYEKGKYVIFQRKKDWWAKDLKYFKNRFNVDKIKYIVIKEISRTWEYFKKVEIDTHEITHPTYWHDKTDIDEFKNGYIEKLWFFYDSRQSAWGIYLNQDFNLFKDKNLRLAFAHSMNFKKVNEEILRNEYYRLNHDFVGYGKYSNENIKAREYDIDKVGEYMKASGWSRGDDGIWTKTNKRYSVKITYSGELNTQRLVVLKEEAKKAGIEIILDELDATSSFKKGLEKKHEAILTAWTTSFRPQYWEHYHSDNAHKTQTNNFSNTDNKELNKLIDEYRSSIDEEKRIKLSLEIQEILYNEGAFVPAFMIPYTRFAYWRWWRLPNPHGTKHTSSDPFFPFMESDVFSNGGLFWYDEKLYKETKEAMKKGKKFEPVTIVDETYKMDIIK